MHGFHRTCLQAATSAHPSANAHKLRQVEVLSQDIRTLEDKIHRKKVEQKRSKQDKGGGFSLMNALNIWNNRREEEMAGASVEKEEKELKAKKEEIDAILAAECLYCGPGIVDTITIPFDNDYLRDSWKI